MIKFAVGVIFPTEDVKHRVADNNDRYGMSRKLIRITMLSLVCLICSGFGAEKAKIVKVLDSNLFRLKDGRLIRLANVDAPSVHDPNSHLASLAWEIRDYSKSILLSQPAEMEYAGTHWNTFDTIAVHLFQKYPFKKLWFNKMYLENGFGKFIPEADTTYRSEYLQAEAKAKQKGRGLWKYGSLKPVEPFRRSYTVMGGIIENSDYHNSFKSFLISTDPPGSQGGFGISLSVSDSRQLQEYGGYKNEYLFMLNPHWAFSGKYLGIEPGYTILFSQFPTEVSSFTFFVLLDLKVNAGLISKFYLSLDYHTDLIFSPASVGINYLSNKPYFKLWVGYTPSFNERKMFSMKSEFLVRNKMLFRVELLQYSKQYDPGPYYGWRIGLGFVTN